MGRDNLRSHLARNGGKVCRTGSTKDAAHLVVRVGLSGASSAGRGAITVGVVGGGGVGDEQPALFTGFDLPAQELQLSYKTGH